MKKQYHINVSSEEIENSKHLIICGDPGRVPRISKHLKNPREISFNREYLIHLGYLGEEDRPVVVSSCGIGSPSTAIGIEEFGLIGVDTIIRVGTSGILSQTVKLGDIVSATGAIRDEGTTQEYLPLNFPAVAHPDVVFALRKAAHTLDLLDRFHEGIVHSKDAFYSETPKEMIPDNTTAENKWKTWIKAGTMVTEMECSALFVIGSIRGWRTGGIMAAIGNTESGEIIVDHNKGQEEAIIVAIEAIRRL
ncbi:MAG: nucleoside phosphorylase [Candidatus Hodarchaeales archaeon]|jgi:uridine phosphorylase